MSKSTCKDYFENLAARICELWKAERCDELAFPIVAQRVLDEDPPDAKVSFIDAVRYGFFTYPLPFQADIEARFGQPPLTVFWQPDFRIEVLFWQQGLIDIHQHAFSGAFHVMEGSSLHTTWDFQCEERVDTQLLFGRLNLKKAELLRAGDTRPIRAGNSFIHATYHLERPTISVVIRTNGEKYQLPQYTYLQPSVAYEARDISPRIKRHLQLLRLLGSSHRYDELVDILFELLGQANHHSAFHYLLKAETLFKDDTNRDLILQWAGKKHARLVEVCRPVLMNVGRSYRIKNVIDKIAQPSLQYFMALLLNVPRRQEIFNLIRERYPDGDPIALTTGWMNELSRLGLPDVSLPETGLELLPGLLSAAPPAQTIRAISAGREQEATAARMREVDQSSKAVRNHWLLQPLFV